MKSSLLELDPHGDTILVLVRPNLSRIAKSISESTDFDAESGYPKLSKKERKKRKKEKASSPVDDVLLEQSASENQPHRKPNKLPAEEENDANRSSKEPDNLAALDEAPESFLTANAGSSYEPPRLNTNTLNESSIFDWHGQTSWNNNLADVASLDAISPFEPNNETPTKICYRVSSSHLSLSSSMFQKMLRSSWKEAEPAQNHMRIIEAHDWNARALLHVLDIIHGHIRSVPRKVSLDSLVEIAVIIDYYDCHEICENSKELWIANLRRTLQEQRGRDITTLWILVSWIFSLEDMFEEMTLRAIKEEEKPITFSNMAVPETVASRIEESWLNGFQEVTALLNTRESEYKSATSCFNCSALKLGALIKERTKHNLDATTLEMYPPSWNRSLKEVISTVSDFEEPDRTYCSGVDHRFGSKKNHQEFKATLKEDMVMISGSIKGLSLADFKSP